MNTSIRTGAPTRPIHIHREGDHFRLSFEYDRDLVERIRAIHWAEYNRESRTWTIPLSNQAMDALLALHYEGLLNQNPEHLLEPGEVLSDAPDAVLRRGTASRPYVVSVARKDEALHALIKAVPTAYYSKESQGWTCTSQAAAALADLVEKGVLADPDDLLSGEHIQVTFDVRSGRFTVLCPDERAQAAFDAYFTNKEPGERKDVVAEWRKLGMDVTFTDPFSEEVYLGELLDPENDGIQPDGFLIDLYPYQKHAVALGTLRSGILIADEPGLGKSSQAIGIAYQSMNDGQANRTVIICPAHLRTQWADEIKKFTGETGVVVIDGGPKERDELYQQALSSRWTVIHYDILSRDLARIRPIARGSIVVADEVHRIRNSRTKRSKAVRELGKHASKRVGLSATAVENSPDEWFWVLSGFCVPGCLGTSFLDFGDRYMYKSPFGGYEGARNLKELHRRSRPHFLRRRKKDVATHLPPLRVQHIPLDPEPGYAQLLRRVHRDAKSEIASSARMQAAAAAIARATDQDEEAALEAAAGMTAVGMLRMLCQSPRLLRASDSEAAASLIEAGLVPDVDGPKVDEVRRIAAEYKAAGERVVVFTFFKRMAYLLADRLREDGIPYVMVTGDSSRKERDDAVSTFTDPDADVTVLISTDAGAEGLNLNATCWTLVNVDIPWTGGRLEQRANRIHRLDGKHENYLVLNLTIRGTIEDAFLRRIEQKVDLVDSIMGDSDGRQRTTGFTTTKDIIWDVLSEM